MLPLTARSLGLMMLVWQAMPASYAQTPPPRSEPPGSLTALRCELRSVRTPEADQIFYFYLNDARRQVLDAGGNQLGNVVQYTDQRVVVTRSGADGGGVRTFTFDRMIGALIITGSPQGGSRASWPVSGDCQRVDSSRQKF